jgi:hypothetical protein
MGKSSQYEVNIIFNLIDYSVSLCGLLRLITCAIADIFTAAQIAVIGDSYRKNDNEKSKGIYMKRKQRG